MSDLNALAARATEGNSEALAELCQALETPIFKLCVRMLGDVRDAEDAAQDVLVKVITHLGTFGGRSALMTWVHAIAVRHVLGLKKSRAEERAVDEDGLSQLLEMGLAFGASTQAVLTPEDRALRSEVRLSCTQGMLMMLSRDERFALVAVELLGLDAAEAADLAEISHEAMRQRLSRARTRLSNFLQAKCGLVNPDAACRCEKQIAGKKSLGLTAEKQRYAPLAMEDLPSPADVAAASAEVRSINTAFREAGSWGPPATLRTKMAKLLPTLLRE